MSVLYICAHDVCDTCDFRIYLIFLAALFYVYLLNVRHCSRHRPSRELKWTKKRNTTNGMRTSTSSDIHNKVKVSSSTTNNSSTKKREIYLKKLKKIQVKWAKYVMWCTKSCWIADICVLRPIGTWAEHTSSPVSECVRIHNITLRLQFSTELDCSVCYPHFLISNAWLYVRLSISARVDLLLCKIRLQCVFFSCSCALGTHISRHLFVNISVSLTPAMLFASAQLLYNTCREKSVWIF